MVYKLFNDRLVNVKWSSNIQTPQYMIKCWSSTIVPIHRLIFSKLYNRWMAWIINSEFQISNMCAMILCAGAWLHHTIGIKMVELERGRTSIADHRWQNLFSEQVWFYFELKILLWISNWRFQFGFWNTKNEQWWKFPGVLIGATFLRFDSRKKINDKLTEYIKNYLDFIN